MGGRVAVVQSDRVSHGASGGVEIAELGPHDSQVKPAGGVRRPQPKRVLVAAHCELVQVVRVVDHPEPHPAHGVLLVGADRVVGLADEGRDLGIDRLEVRRKRRRPRSGRW